MPVVTESDGSEATLPLHGKRVLDFSRQLAGPFCGQILSDLGADVIKIEHPSRPDDMRRWPPFDGDLSVYFSAANRNKRAVTLDLKTPESGPVLDRLLESADVVVENFRFGVRDELGLTIERIHEVNPRIVVCSIEGYGPGPNEARPAYDAAIQAFTGIMSVTGEKDGPVQRAGVAIIDLGAAQYAAIGVAGALVGVQRDGVGRHVRVSLHDAGVASMAYQIAAYAAVGKVISRNGTSHPAMAPTRVFATGDDTDGLLIVVTSDREWRAFCDVLGHDEWFADPRFETAAARVTHQDELHGLIAGVIRTRPRDEWIALFEAHGVPNAPVRAVDEVATDPQIRETMLTTATHDAYGDVQLVRGPIRIDGAPLPVRYPPPAIGEHADEILTSLGYSATQIAGLRDAGVL